MTVNSHTLTEHHNTCSSLYDRFKIFFGFYVNCCNVYVLESRKKRFHQDQMGEAYNSKTAQSNWSCPSSPQQLLDQVARNAVEEEAQQYNK